jgi:hypothetical protein
MSWNRPNPRDGVHHTASHDKKWQQAAQNAAKDQRQAEAAKRAAEVAKQVRRKK